MSKVTNIKPVRRRRRSAERKVEVSARGITIGKRATRADMSRQVEESEAFTLDIDKRTVIKTPYALKTLHDLHEKSSILRQCIQSYVTNITTNGFKVVPCIEDGTMDEQEQRTLQSFIDSPNTEESLRAMHDKHVNAYEKYGFSFVEAIRDKSGKPSLLKHASPSSTRLTTRSSEEIDVRITVKRGGKRARIIERKRFRTYVQQIGSRRIYYKEFGDPRRLDYTSGRFEDAENPVPDNLLATELIHDKQASEDPYGIPRWISMIPSILGSREAEEVNLRYFEDNTVPPMFLTVAGGRLTRQAYDDLQTILSGAGVGRERQNQIILLEAVPEVADVDGKGTVQLQIEKLTDARQSDGLFKEYDDANSVKIRSAFRLPPVFLGMSQDMTFATANVSAYIAEVQVFAPERQTHDEFYNKRFVNHPNGLNLKTVKLESRGPSNTSPDQVVKTLTALNVMGGLTPRSAIDAVNETMRLSIPQYPEKGVDGYEEWMDQPMPYSLATSKAQQTGEGQNTQAGQKSKDGAGKKTEKTGDTAPAAPEHGKE